jgi:hypothetical protein
MELAANAVGRGLKDDLGAGLVGNSLDDAGEVARALGQNATSEPWNICSVFERPTAFDPAVPTCSRCRASGSSAPWRSMRRSAA